MRVLVKEADAVLADLSFDEEEVSIGSDPGCSIHLPDYRISGRNAIITADDERNWWLDTLDYNNPIRVNNHVLRERIKIENGDEIGIYGYLLKIYLDADLSAKVVEDPHLSTEELARVMQYPLPAGSVVKRHFEGVTLATAQLDLVARLGLELSTCRDLHQIVDMALRLSLDYFNARVAWIGLRLKTEGELEVLAGRLRSGQSCGANQFIDLLQYRCVERAQHICLRKIRDDPEVGSAMGVPLNAGHGSLGMLYVDRRTNQRRFQIPDLDLFSTLAAHVAAKAAQLLQQRAQRTAAITSTEVSVVHSIQAHLDPSSAPHFKGYQMAAYSRSGQDSPGDLYDVMKHPDTQITAFLMGHVNSTGAHLALSIARLHSTFRVGFLHNDPPQALARALNWLMYNEKDPSTVDALFLIMDPPSGKMKFCRAGRIGGFIVSQRGEPRALQGSDGPPIGQVRNFEYVSRMEQIQPGETLALYSRGVATALNAQGERFGEKRFIELVCDGFCQPPANTLEDVTHELTNFFSDGRHPDDITIVLLHRLIV